MITWIVGSGGLLGRNLVPQVGMGFDPGSVPWGKPERAARALFAHAKTFRVLAADQPWRIIWAAGAATTSTPGTLALEELTTLRGLVEGVREAPPKGDGCFFLASSAGGVYAGSSGAPFDASSPTKPLSPYGELKIAQEALVAQTLGDVAPFLIGRLSNLYGPGQDLSKPQGLISQLARCAAMHQVMNIFVPLDTVRDYIYAEDAARVINAITRDVTSFSESSITVIASGEGTTVGQLISTMNNITKRRIPIAYGDDASSGYQASDLRLTPTTAVADPTPLAAGMKAVYLDVMNRFQQSGLHAERS